ncbi:MAG: hypothetical protein D6741_05205 [Planctomycetota bacterium]|nr:MAG: hypothetical protein D6741_05205 [Planctomycetota bacterium]
MPFERFDRSRLHLLPLRDRIHDVDRRVMMSPQAPAPSFSHPALEPLARRIVAASQERRAVILACGAHVLREGAGPLLIDWMARGLLTHLALNGAGAIHDFELAMIGATCESVARYVREGQFGLWRETGHFNEAAVEAAKEDIGLGEALGRMIEREGFPYRETSVLAAGVRLGVPVTVHVAFGQDIVHEHPNFDPQATGIATYNDFLVFCRSVEDLEGGVFLNIGTAVMGPEVYLKALAMARNVAHRQGRSIRHFTTAVFDMAAPEEGIDTVPPKTDPRYYFRPLKTVLVRTVADGGESFSIRGPHRQMLPALYHAVIAAAKRSDVH